MDSSIVIKVQKIETKSRRQYMISSWFQNHWGNQQNLKTLFL